MTNVKVEVYERVRDGSSVRPGASSVSVVKSNLEGTLVDTKGQDIKMINGVPTILDKPVTFQLIVKREFLFNAQTDTFYNNLSFFNDGFYLTVTHYRHPVTRGWIANTQEKQNEQTYQITYIENSDLLGDYVVVSLKNREKK